MPDGFTAGIQARSAKDAPFFAGIDAFQRGFGQLGQFGLGVGRNREFRQRGQAQNRIQEFGAGLPFGTLRQEEIAPEQSAELAKEAADQRIQREISGAFGIAQGQMNNTRELLRMAGIQEPRIEQILRDQTLAFAESAQQQAQLREAQFAKLASGAGLDTAQAGAIEQTTAERAGTADLRKRGLEVGIESQEIQNKIANRQLNFMENPKVLEAQMSKVISEASLAESQAELVGEQADLLGEETRTNVARMKEATVLLKAQIKQITTRPELENSRIVADLSVRLAMQKATSLAAERKNNSAEIKLLSDAFSKLTVEQTKGPQGQELIQRMKTAFEANREITPQILIALESANKQLALLAGKTPDVTGKGTPSTSEAVDALKGK
jgi:hypothetical protein